MTRLALNCYDGISRKTWSYNGYFSVFMAICLGRIIENDNLLEMVNPNIEIRKNI